MGPIFPLLRSLVEVQARDGLTRNQLQQRLARTVQNRTGASGFQGFTAEGLKQLATDLLNSSQASAPVTPPPPLPDFVPSPEAQQDRLGQERIRAAELRQRLAQELVGR